MISASCCAFHRPGLLRSLLTLVFGLGIASAHAGLFDDDEARKAILELRQRVDAVRQSEEESTGRSVEEFRRLNEENTQLRRSLLDFQNQIESLKQEQAGLRGHSEQLARDITEVQRRQKDMLSGVDERLRKFEPLKVTVDGREFFADPTEKRDFDNAFAMFRKGEFALSQSAFLDFLKRYPLSGYSASGLFWLANSLYGTKDYKEALANFKALVVQFPDYVRAPEALLSAANCLTELKDNRGVRKILEDLLKNYPQSEAALAGRERLARLK